MPPGRSCSRPRRASSSRSRATSCPRRTARSTAAGSRWTAPGRGSARCTGRVTCGPGQAPCRASRTCPRARCSASRSARSTAPQGRRPSSPGSSSQERWRRHASRRRGDQGRFTPGSASTRSGGGSRARPSTWSAGSSSAAARTSGGGKPRYRRWARSTSSASGASTRPPTARAIHAASAVSSSSAISRSCRVVSARTSHVRRPPASTPPISSHQLNSAAISGRTGKGRGGRASRPRITDPAGHGARLHSASMPAPLLPVAALVSVLAAITVTPDPVAFQLGPIPVFWYGVCYAVGLALAYVVITREARRRGLDARLVDNGIIIVAVAALIGGRLYHVIDQWQLYQDDPLKIVLPPYTGLGVYGGILTGTIAAVVVTRMWKQPFWKWADVIAPGLFVMQAIGRWGNFFNQELYGPPTTLPWGIRIDCAHRLANQYPCSSFPLETTHFHPLFLYESVSGIVGALVLLWLARRRSSRLVPGDLLLIFFIWYGLTRFGLETLRADNWTFYGIPTAQIVTLAFILVGAFGLVYRHGPGRPAARAVELLPDRSRERTADDEEDAFWSDDIDTDRAEGADAGASDEP